MSNPQKENKQQEVDNHDNIDLRGTLISVSILGLFLLLSWLGVWYIFISRL